MQIPEHISLYVHIPWCEKKCLYCDFNSHEMRESIPEEYYLDALLRDISENRKYLIDRKIMSKGRGESIRETVGVGSVYNGVRSNVYSFYDKDLLFCTN